MVLINERWVWNHKTVFSVVAWLIMGVLLWGRWRLGWRGRFAARMLYLGAGLLLLGYAGWGEGQLEDELGENVWLTADADPELIFDADYDGKWARAVAGLGIDPAQLSGQSGRA